MNITEMTDKISNLLTNAQEIVNDMPNQARKRLTDLASESGETLGMDSDEALPFITWFAHNCDGVEMSKGRTGGLYKGSKPAPGSKTKKIKIETVQEESDSAEDISDDDLDLDSDIE